VADDKREKRAWVLIGPNGFIHAGYVGSTRKDVRAHMNLADGQEVWAGYRIVRCVVRLEDAKEADRA
jgi:hypothetical protein